MLSKLVSLVIRVRCGICGICGLYTGVPIFNTDGPRKGSNLRAAVRWESGLGAGEILGPDLETTENYTEISGSTSGRSGQGSGRGRRSGKGRGRAGVAGSGYISSWFYLLQCDQCLFSVELFALCVNTPVIQRSSHRSSDTLITRSTLSFCPAYHK